MLLRHRRRRKASATFRSSRSRLFPRAHGIPCAPFVFAAYDGFSGVQHADRPTGTRQYGNPDCPMATEEWPSPQPVEPEPDSRFHGSVHRSLGCRGRQRQLDHLHLAERRRCHQRCCTRPRRSSGDHGAGRHSREPFDHQRRAIETADGSAPAKGPAVCRRASLWPAPGRGTRQVVDCGCG